MARPSFLHPAAFSLALALLAAAPAAPALATSCDMHTIDARSVDENAQSIWEASEILGFGFVRQGPGAPVIQQQVVEIFAPLKGEASVVPVAPKSVNKVGRMDWMTRWFDAKPDEVRLFALVRTPEGAATPTCVLMEIISKPASELYPALARLAQERAAR